MNEIKNSLKISRIQKQLTQEELAEKIGVTRQTIGLIEKGSYNPTITLCLRICKELGITLGQLFWMEDEKNEK